MSDLERFNFDGHVVRTVLDEHGEPWFYARDVCDVLNIRQVNAVLRALDEDEKGTTTVSTPGGPQQASTVSESGLYAVVLRSRKPQAKEFRKWITSEVIPSIRRTGSYSVEIVQQSKPRDSLDVLRSVVDELISVRDRVGEVEVAVERADLRALDAADDARVANARLDAIEGHHDWFAALGWAKVSGFARTDDVTLNRISRIAGTIGRSRGLIPGKSPHAHYGEVNTWPRDVWDQARVNFESRG